MKKKTYDVVNSLHGIWYESDSFRWNLDVKLHWSKEDPAVVLITAQMIDTDAEQDKPLEWELSREILVRATIFGTSNGEMDVIAEPTVTSAYGPTILLHLSSHEGHVHYLLPRTSLYRFLGDTLAWVNLDEENLAPLVDDALARILAR